MKILIVIATDHFYAHSGWYYLSIQLQHIIQEMGPKYSAYIKRIPYTSFFNSSYYFYTYKNQDLQDNYDYIIVCEGKPSKKWAKNGKIIWIPCQEFLSGGPWNAIADQSNDWFSIISPSNYLCEKINKINPTIDAQYMQLWTEGLVSGITWDQVVEAKDKSLNLYFHFRTRHWGEDFYVKLFRKLQREYPEFKYILKFDDHCNLNIQDINLNNVVQILG